jgi:hypothetical protein
MSGRSRQGDWGEYSDRARQPLRSGAARQRRGASRQRPDSGRNGHPRGYPDSAAGAGYEPDFQQARARVPQTRPGRPNGGGRSRFVAIVVLIVAAVIVTIGGMAASQSGSSSGSGATVSISILPFPQNTVTTAAQ